MTQDKNLKDIVYQVLEIIRFDGNKGKFSEEFVSLVLASTITELVEKISISKEDAFQGISEKTKPQELVDLIIAQVGKDEFEKYYQKNSVEKLNEYFAEISGTISKEEKKRILELILN